MENNGFLKMNMNILHNGITPFNFSMDGSSELIYKIKTSYK